MLDLIGWGRSTGNGVPLTAHVIFATGQYSVLSTESPWLPQPGDVFTDPNGLVDTVVSVDADPTLFNGVSNHAGWAAGFATVVRSTSTVPSNKVNFRGLARAFDNPATKSTDLVLKSGNAIEDIYSTVGDFYAPAGFPYVSIIEVVPQSNLIEINEIWYHAPQGLKILDNTHATNSFVLKHNNFSTVAENNIITTTAADITVAPGESVALIRDTQGSNNRWRAGRNSPLVP